MTNSKAQKPKKTREPMFERVCFFVDPQDMVAIKQMAATERTTASEMLRQTMRAGIRVIKLARHSC